MLTFVRLAWMSSESNLLLSLLGFAACDRVKLSGENCLKPTVLYVVSRPHSGSTLLGLLMNAHSRVLSVGELKKLLHHQTCTCHGVRPEDCPFWSQVATSVRDSVGLALHELDLRDCDNEEKFVRDNQALYSAIALVSGYSFIVDSSKNLLRLKGLIRAVSRGAQFDLIPIYLRRGPFGTLNSARRKKEALRVPIYDYNKYFFQSRACLNGIHHSLVYYENLAQNPRRELSRVMRDVGLPFEESQLSWRNSMIRDIGGNRMRRETSDVIRLDQSWRRELSLHLKIKIFIQTLPVRMRSRRLFEWLKPWIKPAKVLS